MYAVANMQFVAIFWDIPEIHGCLAYLDHELLLHNSYSPPPLCDCLYMVASYRWKNICNGEQINYSYEAIGEFKSCIDLPCVTARETELYR